MASIILGVILGLVFLGAGGTKLAGVPMQIENFKSYRYPYWFRYVVGAVETLGGLGLLLGTWAPAVAFWSAAALIVTMIGAVYTDAIQVGSLTKALAPLVLLILLLLYAFVL